MLDQGLATLGEPHRSALPIPTPLEPILGPSRTRQSLQVPLRYTHLSERVRNGDIVPVDLGNVPNARMGYLAAEDRILPFARTTSTVWELTWDGHIVGELTDQRLGEARESFWQAFPESLPTASVTREALALRPTVSATAEWIDRLPLQTNVIEDVPFAQATREMKAVVECGAVDDAPSAIFYSLSFMYRRSRTLRWIVSQADHGQSDLLKLRIEPGAAPAYERATHSVVVPPLSEIEEIEYLSRTGPTLFKAEAVWLHEFIHAMTLLDDPVRSLASEHRGPVVYLTDRVLYEANRSTPERVVYAGPSRRVSQAERTLPSWRDQAKTVVYENIVLDDKLAAKVPMTPKTWVLGTPVKHRATVEAAIKIEASVLETMEAELEPAEAFPSRLLRHLGPVFPLRGTRTPQIQWLRAFISDAKTLYDASPWNRAFLEGWIRQTGGRRWTVQIRTLLKDSHSACQLTFQWLSGSSKLRRPTPSAI